MTAKLKTIVFLVVLVLLNAAAAWYVTTRVQMQIFLDPNALAFRVGSQMPEGATDRGTVALTQQSQLPGFGRILISSPDGLRTFRFEKLFHGDQPAKIILTETSAGLNFTALGPGAGVQEAIDLADQFGAFLTAEGFTPNPRAVEDTCLRLDRMDPAAGSRTDAINKALATGMCGVRSGAFMVFRKVRGTSTVTAMVVPDAAGAGNGSGTMADAEVSLLVILSAGER